MKTPEDEAFDDLAKRQGGFQAKRAMAAAKLQEPVKDWVASHNSICALLRQAHDALALTSYPPQRKWVGLTDDDCKGMSAGDKVVAMWANRILKEKNT